MSQPRAYLLFTGSGPILALTTYPTLDDERLLTRLRAKGIERFLAYEVALDHVRERYAAYDDVAGHLAATEDLRVLDFNGHQIMANFSLADLAAPVHVGE